MFCSQSIDRIVLNPNASSSTNLFYTASISPNSGAIEYTVAAFGQYTLYCDQYGIRSVDQTDVYGDFIGRPLSFPISPWISQRLSGNRYWLDSGAQSARYLLTLSEQRTSTACGSMTGMSYP